MATEVGGRPFVPLKPMCQSLGIDEDAQRRKLAQADWAVTSLITATGSDGKSYQMTALDADHLPMWLVTIQPSRVATEARQVLSAFQREAAGALRDYFYQGVAVNPRADEHQVNALIFQSRAQMELCAAAKGLIHPDHLEAKARVVLARGLGEHAELDQSRRPLYTQSFLKEKNLTSKKMTSTAGIFGKKVKAAYIDKHGRAPKQYPLDLSNGQTRPVNAYTEADRPLMEQVWKDHFAR
ncbi:phage antirepressor N-terminal domain-containing protein, partial [Rhodococcus jostii]|uniref:phage antirepressor N-terminal domain-containing protein n=1 Tax=Rhodococcus jostii TaxID=132919 RepID=UPI00362CBCC6